MAGENVTTARLVEVGADLLVAAGVTADESRLLAGMLVFAQASGIDSHGLMHLPHYIAGIAAGTVNPRPRWHWTSALPAVATLDADRGLGGLAGALASDRAVELARDQGVGVVAVRNSGHFGAASAFIHRMVERGMAALVMSNASPTVAPRGGRTAVTGTNPIAAGFPRAGAVPVIIDLATTVGSRARIRKAAAAGEPIPADWACDASGQPTTDAKAALAGTMQSLGGTKGAGLGLMIELLCAGLSGGTLGVAVRPPQDTAGPSGVSHFFVALNPRAFGDGDAVAGQVDRIACAVEQSLPSDPRVPVRVPGSRAAAARRTAESAGVVVTPALAAALAQSVEMLQAPHFKACRV